eukprot:9488906-Pyramimonas_sp.AAC.5
MSNLNTTSSSERWSKLSANPASNLEEPVDRIYWVIAGNLSLLTPDEDGQMAISEVLAPGHHFGERAMLPDERSQPLWNCEIVARESCVLVYFGKASMDVSTDHPDPSLLTATQSSKLEVHWNINQHDDPHVVNTIIVGFYIGFDRVLVEPSRPGFGPDPDSRGGRFRANILTTGQSYAGSAGIFSRRTHHTREARVYSHDGPIGLLPRP